MGWAAADWEEGKWLGEEDLEAGDLDRHAGGKVVHMKGAWVRKRALRSSSWTADFEIPPQTCMNWTWTFP